VQINDMDLDDTQLHLAAQEAGLAPDGAQVLSMEMAKLLLTRGADGPKKKAMLFIACQQGHVEVAKLLLTSGVDKETTMGDGLTPLLIACQQGHVQVAKLLLTSGADKDKSDSDGATPLLMACKDGHLEVAKLLVESGADKDKAMVNNIIGLTPLLVACQQGHLEVAKLLIASAADNDDVPSVNSDRATSIFIACTESGHTLLHLAAVTGHTEVCRMLLSTKGVDANARDHFQHTPLHLAADQGHDSTCMLFVFYGADLTGSQTPAELAQLRGHTVLAVHLRPGGSGAHYLRCTGPSLERRLLWNDTDQLEQEEILNEMQAQWLTKVEEGCAHARVGLTLRSVYSGKICTRLLTKIVGYMLGGTELHLLSCVSSMRVAPNLLAGTIFQQQQQQQQQHPRLALASHALALKATPRQLVDGPLSLLHRLARPVQQHQLAVFRTELMAAAVGCEWLYVYCHFLEQRHRVF
jgi:ankyrin repeat protein